MYLTKDQILGAALPRETVDVPEWGGKVLVQALSAAGLSEYQDHIVKVEGTGKNQKVTVQQKGAAVLLASLCIVDEAGEPLFGTDETAALGRASGAALGRVVEVAKRLSGMTDEDDEAAEKN